ncbi:hypothetical protein BaRGS_00003238 [Batillaria attramentaria]|uniref:Xanthine dehydrogenase n=1 Tax=Batillaria attramentaria TaxID=370345 RepID=A0ABD0M1E1_9CAEN
MAAADLIFFVNGKKNVLPKPDPEMTLLQYLRSELQLTGTKLGCGEGGCGACTVMVSYYTPDSDAVRHLSANACLVPLCSLHGMAVTTVEGIGSLRTRLHPVQKRLAAAHGSQCGFCSPGFVMSMYTLLRNNPTPSLDDLETVFDGNLCRCTGYRPILEAYRPFTKEYCDKGDKCCMEGGGTSGEQTPGNQNDEHDAASGSVYDPSQEPIFPPFLKLEGKRLHEQSLQFIGPRVMWYRPSSLSELLDIKRKHPDCKIVIGNTVIGIETKFKKRLYPVLVAATHVKELSAVQRLDTGIQFGASVTLATMDSTLKIAVTELPEEKTRIFSAFVEMLRWFGCHQIRNVAAIGGNIMAASPTSDLNPLLLACGAVLELGRTDGNRRFLKIDASFFKDSGRTAVDPAEILVSILIPFSKKNEFFYGFKQAHRKEMDASIVNAGMRVVVDDVAKVTELSLAFGGVSNVTVMATNTMKQLIDVKPADRIATEPLKREPVEGFQWFEVTPEPQSPDSALRRPLVHESAYKQASGEALFADDLAPRQGELYLSLVLSSKAHARLVQVDPTPALAMPGVVDFVSHRDIPGKNSWRFCPDDVVFAVDKVVHQGQPIGAIVADTKMNAQRAAQADAIEKESYFPYNNAVSNGDVDKAMAEADHVLEGEVHIEAQEHFYLEPQVTIAYPGEDGEIEVVSATQSLTLVQQTVAGVLGLPLNKVRTTARRVGGAFGGKETRDCMVTLPVVVAAVKHGRPVRCALERDEDMMMTGTRHPCLGKYKIGFSSDGTIQAYDVMHYVNAGCSTDLSLVVLDYTIMDSDCAYNIPNRRMRGRACKTNLPSCTAFRAFGRPQAKVVTETAITRVAAHLKMAPEKVRERNMYKLGDSTHYRQVLDECNLQRCWADVMKQSEFDTRREEVDDFNRKNRWRKRGISVVPGKFGLAFYAAFLHQGAALVNIYSDGTVLVSHGGVEMGQGLHTKMLQLASEVLQVPVSKIRVTETNVAMVPNTSPTSGSVSSDLCGGAVVNACQTLMERLEPIRAQNPNGSWEELIGAAYFQRVSLSATGFYKTPDVGFDFTTNTGVRPTTYFTFGAACCAVEIDCLTGDHQVLSTDIVFDVGKSINPAIDVGQIEGAFMQGYGLMVLEQYKVQPDGTLLTRGPGTYKIPSVGNIPQKFNVTLLRESGNPRAVYSAKGIGEPPLLLATSVLCAVHDAIRAARKDEGLDLDFRLDTPATPARIRMACSDRFTKMFEGSQENKTTDPWFVQL